MGRPRKATDEEILEAALGVMMRLGPTQWTLADVAGEVGLTPGAIVQRFGSKRALQIRLAEEAAGGATGMLEALREAHLDPLDTLLAYARQVACMAESPAMLAHHLSYLQQDLVDPELRRPLKRQALHGRSFIRGLLDEAVEAGTLRAGTDTDALARSVEAAISGSLMTWAIYQEGPAEAWMVSDVDRVLAPYRIG